MRIILDADILSAFLKINKIDLLKKLFDVAITQRVHEEVLFAVEYGYKFPLSIDKEIEIIFPSLEETKSFEELLIKEEKLGKGEIESMIICKKRKIPFASMDKVAMNFAEKNNIETISLHAILKSLWRLKIISKEEVEKIVEEIELKDKTKISNKELIFGDRV